ncbi:tRNA pseudouridine(55) synthase TruB [Alphaproteobacteria bacterium]|nr:tRNA pseudouridine(55) synthase TruB [Alphaproteobacteria bacterium]
MSRRKKGDPVHGWINLDKPIGLTSTQAVGKVRRFLNAQKVGHAGTLDPLATGVLPIALGEATKTIPYIQDAFKTYEFTVSWGEQRDTDDSEGEIVATSDSRPTQEAIEDALPCYIGEIEQTPPRFSAIKINGQRAYDLARDGEEFEIKSRIVFVESLELLKVGADSADFVMTCGKGTYVRSLGRDLALKLGTYGYISALRRSGVGSFTTQSAISLDKLEEMGNIAARNQALLPLEVALDDIPALPLKGDEAARLKNGQVLKFTSRPDFDRLEKAGLTGKTEALASVGNDPVALVEVEGIEIKPVRVFNL